MNREVLKKMATINLRLDEAKDLSATGAVNILRPMKTFDWAVSRWDGQRWQVHKGYPMGHEPIPCPYGERGDILWVREPWALVEHADDTVWRFVALHPDYRDDSPNVAVYRADGEFEFPEGHGGWRPANSQPSWSWRGRVRVLRVSCVKSRHEAWEWLIELTRLTRNLDE